MLVRPRSSALALEGASSTELEGVGHNELLYSQRTRQLVLAFGGHLPDEAGLFQHALGLLDDLLAQRRDLYGGLGAFEQRDAQLFFQLLHGDRQRGLRHVAALGGASEVALLGQGYDITEFC